MTHVVVIGAGGGIGRAILRDQATAGATLSLIDVDPDALADARTEATGHGSRNVATLVTDPSTRPGVDALTGWLAERPHPVDGLVYAAGITGPVAAVTAYDADAFDQVLRVNLHGPFLLLSRLLPRLAAGATLSIVMIGSTSSIRGRAGLAGYVASKHALLGLVRSAAMDLAGEPVRINAVLPGPIDTPMLTALNNASATTGHSFGRNNATTPAGTPKDVADTVAFLLSERSRHVRGAAWVLDGGSTIG